MTSHRQFNELAATIRSNAPSNCIGPRATSSDILETELALGVRLPTGYKWFLAEFGWLAWPDYIAGFSPISTRCENVVELARSEREDVEPEMPRYLIPFHNDGWGNHFCLDTSRFEGDECPEVFWNHELDADQEPVVVSGSIVEWLEEAVREQLEWERESSPGQSAS